MRFRSLLALAAAFGLGAATAPAASAQVPFIPQFGVLGGVNFGSLTDAASADLDNATGFHIGAFAELGVGPIGVRPAVIFVKAGEITIPSLGGISDAFETSYIAVPVDIRYSPLPTPVIKPYLLVGPEVRLPLGELSDLPNAKSVGLAANIGVGANIGAIIGPKFFGEIRYAFDVSGFRDDEELPGNLELGKVGVNGFFVTVGVGL